MKKIFTKTRLKAFKIALLIAGMIFVVLFTLQLIFLQAIYKPCEEYSATKYGEADYKRIKGVAYNFLGMYSDSPEYSCSDSDTRYDLFFDDKGDYLEKKSCSVEENNKSYIATSYTKCEYGCYGGICMDKCEDSDGTDPSIKSQIIGIKEGTVSTTPGIVTKTTETDHCTNEEGLVEEISYYIVEQTCNENNFIETLAPSKCKTFCFDGICQKENTTQCYDSDKGDHGKNAGEIKYYDLNKKEILSKTDTCMDSKNVAEYFCGEKDQAPHKLILTCRFSCQDGACVQPTHH